MITLYIQLCFRYKIIHSIKGPTLLLYSIHKPTTHHAQHSITKLFSGILCWYGNIALLEQKLNATDFYLLRAMASWTTR